MKKFLIIISVITMFLSVTNLYSQNKVIHDDLYKSSNEKRLSNKERKAIKEAEEQKRKLQHERDKKERELLEKQESQRMQQDVVAGQKQPTTNIDQSYYPGMLADMLNDEVQNDSAKNNNEQTKNSPQPSWAETNNINFSVGFYVPTYFGWNSWYSTPYYSPFYFGYSSYWNPWYNPWYNSWYMPWPNHGYWNDPYHHYPHYGHYPSYPSYNGGIVRDYGRRADSYASQMVRDNRAVSNRVNNTSGTTNTRIQINSRDAYNNRATQTNPNTTSRGSVVRSNTTSTTGTAVRSSSSSSSRSTSSSSSSSSRRR